MTPTGGNSLFWLLFALQYYQPQSERHGPGKKSNNWKMFLWPVGDMKISLFRKMNVHEAIEILGLDLEVRSLVK